MFIATCPQTVEDGLLYRETNNSQLNFNKNWTEYEKGLGDLHTEFWHELAAMHCLTQRGQWETRR